jgi:hypothetical protein
MVQKETCSEPRDLTDDALQTLNWYRKQNGFQPCDRYTRSVVTDEDWEKMKADEREAVWSKYPTKEKP